MQNLAKIALIVAAAAMAYVLRDAGIMLLCVLVLFDWDS